MGSIVSAGFQTQADADRGAMALVDAGFARPNVAVFYLTQPRDEVDAPPIDTANASPGAEDARVTAPAGAGIGAAVGTVIGAAATPVLGPLGIAGGASIGAYVGSLYGALGGMKDHPAAGLAEDGAMQVAGPADPADEAISRIRAGMRVAVEVADDAGADRARRALQGSGALEVAVGVGSIDNGELVEPRPGDHSPAV